MRPLVFLIDTHGRNSLKYLTRNKTRYVLVPLIFMTQLTNWVSSVQGLPHQFDLIRTLALSLFTTLSGPINAHNGVDIAILFSACGIAYYNYLERRPRDAVKNHERIGRIFVRLGAAAIFDWAVVLLLFLGANMSLLAAVGTGPTWAVATLIVFGKSMMMLGILQEFIKKKLGLAVRDPTIPVFDPGKVLRASISLIRHGKREPYQVKTLGIFKKS